MPEFLAQACGVVFFNVQRHFGRRTVQLRQQMGEKVGANRVNRADFQRRIELVLAALGQIPDDAHLIKHPLRLLNNTLTGFGDTDTALAAFEQRDAKLVFQLFHSNTERRLAYMATLGSPAKMPFAGQRNDVS